MKYLLDTHIFLWWILNNSKLSKLSKSAKKAITNAENDLYLSSASTWEMVIKSTIGKLSLPSPPEILVREQLILNAVIALDISIEHTLALSKLPMLHKDPFDRILIAQSICENLTIITDDPLIKAYEVKCL